MKNLKLILLLVLAPLSFFGQTLSGLWMGTVTNDSNSVRKDQSFEIVLSQYKEKVVGYSRSTFIVNDTLYYIVKRVKGTITGDVCEVKDAYVVSHNFPRKPEKGVKVTSTFYRNKQDSTWYLAGDWKTTKTKKYYAVSGKVDLKGETDLSASKLFPHLEELGLDKDVPVFAAAKQAEENAVAKTQSPVVPAKSYDQDPAINKPAKPISKAIAEPTASIPVRKTEPAEGIARNTGPAATPSSQVNTVVTESGNKKEIKPVAGTGSISEPVASNKPVQNTITNTQTDKPVTNTPASTENKIAAVKPVPEVNNSAYKTPVAPQEEQPTVLEDLGSTLGNRKHPPIVNNKPVEDKKATTAIATTTKPVEEKKKTPVAQNDIATVKPMVSPQKTGSGSPDLQKTIQSTPAAAHVAERKTEAPQFVNYVSDSLVLILYDNGEIDGDTVSVLLNGAMFMEKQGLKTSAIKKTIYITPGNEELTLVLYAENLGKYPPNTGLLVVYDGEDRHQLRFSADLRKNASVVFRRKK